MATNTSAPTARKEMLQAAILAHKKRSERYNRKYVKFLSKFKNKRCTSGGIPEKATHTNMPDSSRKFSGGSYIIKEDDDIEAMYIAYSMAVAAANIHEASVAEYKSEHKHMGGEEWRKFCLGACNSIHMTERCERMTPVKIDLDFKYYDTNVDNKHKGSNMRILTIKEQDTMVRILMEGCDKWLDKETVRTWTEDMIQSGVAPSNIAPGTPVPEIPRNPREVLIFQRDNAKKTDDDTYKDGLHIIMPDLLLNTLGQKVLRAHVVQRMRQIGLMCYKTNKAGKINPPTEVYDANPNKVGHYWMMHGSTKSNKKTNNNDSKPVDKREDFNTYKLVRVLNVGMRHNDYAVRTVDAAKYIEQQATKVDEQEKVFPGLEPIHAAEARRVLGMAVRLRMRTCIEHRPVARLRDDFQVDPAFGVFLREGLLPTTQRHDDTSSPSTGTCVLSPALVKYCGRLVADVLSKERAENYADWFRILRALANIAPKGDTALLQACIVWSKKAKQYASHADRACREQWGNMRRSIGSSGPRQLTMRSIEMAAKRDNPKLFASVQNENLQTLLMDSLKTRDYDIARVILMKDAVETTYKCVNQQRKEWYNWEQGSGLWEHGESENPLELRVPTQVYNDLKRVIEDRYKQQLLAANHDDKLVMAASKEKGQCMKKIDCLMNNGKMAAVGSLMAKMLMDQKFVDNLDQILDIISIGGGLVYDLKNNIARNARPEDVVSMSTNQPITLSHSGNGRRLQANFTLDHPLVIAVFQFIKDIFPNHETREYMLKWFASMAGGHTSDELFHFLIGSGANGKSKLQELLKLTYGEYCVTVPVTMFTGQRGEAQGCTSAYEHIRNKRIVFIQEPDSGQRINAGILKELSGGDSLYSRGLYQKAKEFKPQATFALITNHKPAVPADDQALWRRLRICAFPTKFKSNPDPKKPEEKLRDNGISEKLKIWAPAFQWLLLEKYYPVYLEEGLSDEQVPPEIRKETDVYQKEYDIVNSFIETSIIHVSEAGPDTNGGMIVRVVLKALMGKWKMYLRSVDAPTTNKTSKKDVINIFSKYLKGEPCKFDDEVGIGWNDYIWLDSDA